MEILHVQGRGSRHNQKAIAIARSVPHHLPVMGQLIACWICRVEIALQLNSSKKLAVDALSEHPTD
jgi:hypothetical protein